MEKETLNTCSKRNIYPKIYKMICCKCKKNIPLCFCEKLQLYNDNIRIIIKIQSIFRRKFIKKIKDSFTKDILIQLIEHHNNSNMFYNEINKKLITKKLRLPNYPSEITENLVKFAIKKKYNVAPCWDTTKGDLSLFDKKLEVKGSIDLLHGGPSSFGPTEEWHRIYFVDAIDTLKKNFTIYEIKLSNKSEIWKNIKVNKTSTFYDQCRQKRRPRITFGELIKQIPKEYISIIFNGNISEL